MKQIMDILLEIVNMELGLMEIIFFILIQALKNMKKGIQIQNFQKNLEKFIVIQVFVYCQV